MKFKPYVPVNMAEQHEKNRILAQMEADHYWKMQMERQDAARMTAAPFKPLAFCFTISRYARKHHTRKHELVAMSDYCKSLQGQALKVKAKIKFFRGLAS